MPLVAGVTHMAVTRLRTRRDVEKQATLEAVRDMLGGVAGAEDVFAFVERKLAEVGSSSWSSRGCTPT
jgi:hypothetical protein